MKISNYIYKNTGKQMYELSVPNLLGNAYHKQLAIACNDEGNKYSEVVIIFANANLFICRELWESFTDFLDAQYGALDDEDHDKYEGFIFKKDD